MDQRLTDSVIDQTIVGSDLAPTIRRIATDVRTVHLMIGLMAIGYMAVIATDTTRGIHAWLIVAIVLAIAHPSAGIALIAVTVIPPDPRLFNVINIGLFIAVAAASGRLLRAALRGTTSPIPWASVFLVVFGLISLASAMFTLSLPTPSAQVLPAWSTLLTGILACLVVMSDRTHAIRTATFVFGAGAVIAAIASLAVVVPGLFQRGPMAWLVAEAFAGRAMGSTHGANVLGVIAAMSFSFFVVRALGDGTVPRRMGWAALALVNVPAMYFTFSRSAALGVGIAVLLGLLLLRQRAVTLAGVAILGTAIILGPIYMANRLETSSGQRGGGQSLEVISALAKSDRLRIEAWQAGVRMVIDRPLTGVGFGRYYDMKTRYNAPSELNTPHSDYIRFFAETGVMGGAMFLLFLGSVMWALRTADANRAALAAAIATFCVATQFNAQLYYAESGLPFWVATGAAVATTAVGSTGGSRRAGIAPARADPDLRVRPAPEHDPSIRDTGLHAR